jgi:transcriptional regulator with XRE-family HTH domain
MSDIAEHLRDELKDAEYSEGYAESFLDSYIATQIKVLREQRGLSQQGLADLIGTKQGAVSRIEDVNYSKWNVSTLKKLARAFRVRLKVSFETYGSLLVEVTTFSRESLQREPRESDNILNSVPGEAPAIRSRSSRHAIKKARHRRALTIYATPSDFSQNRNNWKTVNAKSAESFLYDPKILGGASAIANQLQGVI